MPVAETKRKALTPVLRIKTVSFVLTQDQKARLAIPSYQKKKEKCDQKAIEEESSSTQVDPALVSVLGVVKDGQGLNSEEASCTPGAKAKKKPSSEESSSRRQ